MGDPEILCNPAPAMSSIRDAYEPDGRPASHQRTLVSGPMSGAFPSEGVALPVAQEDCRVRLRRRELGKLVALMAVPMQACRGAGCLQARRHGETLPPGRVVPDRVSDRRSASPCPSQAHATAHAAQGSNRWGRSRLVLHHVDVGTSILNRPGKVGGLIA